jgi:hypothetical protein
MFVACVPLIEEREGGLRRGVEESLVVGSGWGGMTESGGEDELLRRIGEGGRRKRDRPM